MFDAKAILDGLAQSGIGKAQPAENRVRHAMGPQGLGGQGGILEQLGGLLGGGGASAGGGQGGGGLGGLLSSLGGGGQPGASGGGGLGGLLSSLGMGGGAAGGAGAGGGGGLSDILGQLAGAARGAAGRTTEAVKDNNPVAVGGMGALAGALLGGKGGALGGGLLAVLGSLAYSAMQNSGQAQAGQAAALPPGLADDTESEADSQAAALLGIKAMISAAKADGKVDQDEIQRVVGKLREIGADDEAQSFIMTEMSKPLDIAALVAEVPNDHVALQVYAASLMAIEVDTPAEEAYVADLARRLRLAPESVAEVHRALGLG